MRHRKNKLLKIRGSVQSRDLVMRTMLSNLIRYGYLTTTEKKAKVLVAYTNSFFAKLGSMFNKLSLADAQREVIRYVKSIVFGNEEGKKVIVELLPFFTTKNQNSGFVVHTKLGKRLGDAAELVKIEFIK